MKKRISALVLAIAMLIAVVPAAVATEIAEENVLLIAPATPVTPDAPISPAPEVTLTDVAGEYYEEAALRWFELGVIEGMGDNTFAGQSTATRGQVAAIITRLVGYELLTPTEEFFAAFTDVAKDKWYAPYIYTLNVNGIMLGDGQGKMNPEQQISREEFITMSARALGITSNPYALQLSNINDKASVSSWAAGYVGAYVALGAIKGDENGNLNPSADIIRGDMAVITSATVADYINKGGNYYMNGDGVVVIKTDEPVSISGSFSGHLLASQKSGKVTVAGKSLKAISAQGGEVTLTGKTDLLQVTGKAKATVTEKGIVTAASVSGKDAYLDFDGKAESLVVEGATINVGINAKASSLILEGKESNAVVNGIVEILADSKTASNTKIKADNCAYITGAYISGTDVTVFGSGAVIAAHVSGKNVEISTIATIVSAGVDSENVTAGGKKVEAGNSLTVPGRAPIVSRPESSDSTSEVEKPTESAPVVPVTKVKERNASNPVADLNGNDKLDVFVFGSGVMDTYNTGRMTMKMVEETTGMKSIVTTGFMGHSSTSAFNLYELFVKEARSDINNYTFASGSTASNVKAKLSEDGEGFDALIVQAGRDITIRYSGDRANDIKSFAKLAKLANEKNPGCKIIIVAPYAYQTELDYFNNTEIDTWREHLEKVTFLAEEYYFEALNLDPELNIEIAYVGDLFSYYNSNNTITRRDLYRENSFSTSAYGNFGNRANAKGAYMTACVVYSLLTDLSPLGHSLHGWTYDGIDGTLSADVAAEVQNMVHDYLGYVREIKPEEPDVPTVKAIFDMTDSYTFVVKEVGLKANAREGVLAEEGKIQAAIYSDDGTTRTMVGEWDFASLGLPGAAWEYLGATVVLDMSDESNPKLINTPVKSTFCVAYDQIEFPDSTTAKIKGTDVTIDLSEFNQATLRKDVLIDVDGNYAGAWESAASKNNTSREFTRNTTKDFIFSKITLVNPETGEENVQDLIAFGVAKGTFN